MTALSYIASLSQVPIKSVLVAGLLLHIMRVQGWVAGALKPAIGIKAACLGRKGKF